MTPGGRRSFPVVEIDDQIDVRLDG